MKRRLLVGILTLVSALAFSAGALATFSVSIGTAPSFSVTLDGADQAPTYTVPLTVTNTGGTANGGWNLTITSTQFATGGGPTFPTTASVVTGVAVATCSGGGCNQPVNAITYPVSVPAASTAPVAVKFFNAATNSGKGTVTVTPTVSVAVPGNSFAGTYSSTLTISLVSGP